MHPSIIDTDRLYYIPVVDPDDVRLITNGHWQCRLTPELEGTLRSLDITDFSRPFAFKEGVLELEATVPAHKLWKMVKNDAYTHELDHIASVVASWDYADKKGDLNAGRLLECSGKEVGKRNYKYAAYCVNGFILSGPSEKQVGISAVYYSAIKASYPNAKFYTNGDDLAAIKVMDDDVMVAMIMPMKI